MLRTILGLVAGLAVWLVVVFVAGVIIRASWPDYVRVAGAMTFTLPMKLARLAVGAAATLAAGFTAAALGRARRTATIAGAILLVVFIPDHITLWNTFPVWYHLWFLGSLIPLSVIGGRLARNDG